MFLFLFFSMLLLCSFFRLKRLFQVKNGVTTSLGRSDDGKRRKKEDGLIYLIHKGKKKQTSIQNYGLN